MSRYDHAAVELKWQRRWAEARAFEVDPAEAAAAAPPNGPRRAFYCLEMLPYPSGRLHSGHVRNYSIGDAVAHFRRMSGSIVLHPIGWDALGLPAENAAIERGEDPRDWTLANIAEMKRQLQRLGISYAWDREVATCDPSFYRWNQWFFLRLLERDLVYRSRRPLNWCPRCATVLANEQVEDGHCWRHDDTAVELREMDQWFVRITRYATELDRCLDELPGWPEPVRTMQRNWIGRSSGTRIRFAIEGGLGGPAGSAAAEETGSSIEVFTTRVDTIFGATFLVLAPAHPLVEKLIAGSPQAETVRSFVADARARAMRDRFAVDREKSGLFLGRYAINPFDGERIPIWIANYVLMEYGSGAVMAVPGHDERDMEFATRMHLPVRPVISGDGARLENSGEFTGLSCDEAIQALSQRARAGGFGEPAVTFRLRDWGISRQRFWGTPIPVVHCEGCGIVPVPDSDLPVLLPDQVPLQGVAGSPLASLDSFVNVRCPKCGGPARRETDTMDTFVDSSWYFYRYTDPGNAQAPFAGKAAEPWLPVDLYIGGVAHATGHLIYCRFFHKFLRDLGLVVGDEPIRNLLTQGMVVSYSAFCPEHRYISPESAVPAGPERFLCPEDGQELVRVLEKMSKSKNNAPDLDRMIERYGADTVRMYLLFAAPPENEFLWSEKGIEGCSRLILRIVRFLEVHRERIVAAGVPGGAGGDIAIAALRRATHRTIAQVSEDIGRRLQFNTAIARIMELVNSIYGFFDHDPLAAEAAAALRESFEVLSGLLVPFAPHLAEEIREGLGLPGLAVRSAWPQAEAALLVQERVEMVIQVAGKLRARLSVAPDAAEAEVMHLAQADERVLAALAGRAVARTVFVPGRLMNIVPE